MASAYSVQNGSADASFVVRKTPQITSSTLAMSTIDQIDTAMQNVINQRSALKAISKRLKHTINSLTKMSTSLPVGKS